MDMFVMYGKKHFPINKIFRHVFCIAAMLCVLCLPLRAQARGPDDAAFVRHVFSLYEAYDGMDYFIYFNMDYMERTAAMQAYADALCDCMGVSALEIEVYDSHGADGPERDYKAFCDYRAGKIYISDVSASSGRQAAYYIAHECRHVWQLSCDILSEDAYEREMADSIAHYLSIEEYGEEAYREQPAEQDADRYGQHALSVYMDFMRARYPGFAES